MDKSELRAQAAISILNSLLETTQHSVLECLGIKEIYAKTAVLYADELIKALEEPEPNLKNAYEELKTHLIPKNGQLIPPKKKFLNFGDRVAPGDVFYSEEKHDKE